MPEIASTVRIRPREDALADHKRKARASARCHGPKVPLVAVQGLAPQCSKRAENAGVGRNVITVVLVIPAGGTRSKRSSTLERMRQNTAAARARSRWARGCCFPRNGEPK